MCKCEQKTDFKVALRSALAATTETQQMAVWENTDSKEVFFGTVEQAESRLTKGKIECYFIPKKVKDQVSFDIVDTVPDPELKTAEKQKAPKSSEK